MKKEKQIGVRIGLPVFFLLELEEIYKRREGPHRALAFPDFVSLLVGMGLEAYRKGNSPALIGEAPEGTEEETQEGDPLHLLDMNPAGLPDLFREFDTEMGDREIPTRPKLRLLPTGE